MDLRRRVCISGSRATRLEKDLRRGVWRLRFRAAQRGLSSWQEGFRFAAAEPGVAS